MGNIEQGDSSGLGLEGQFPIMKLINEFLNNDLD